MPAHTLLKALIAATVAMSIDISAESRIPPNILAVLTAKFPQAKIDKWTKEREDGKVVYDIEFKQDGRKFEADIFADGTIHNWEEEIASATRWR